MRATADLFYNLELCIHCKSDAECSLSKIMTLPKKVLMQLIACTTEKEQEVFRDYLAQCPVKKRKSTQRER